MPEVIIMGGQEVPVPPELAEAPDYRAAVAAWHKAELEARNIPHVLMPATELDHRAADGTLMKGGHRGPGIPDADAPVEVPAEVLASGEAAARQWVLEQRKAAGKAAVTAQRIREGQEAPAPSPKPRK